MADKKKETTLKKIISVIRVLFGTAARKYPLFFVWESLKTIISIAQPFIAIMISPMIVDEIVGERDLKKLIFYAAALIIGEFIAAMHRMHIPQQITIPISVMFRFFPTVLEEFASINTAMKMRDIRIGGKNAGKIIEYRLVPLMVCSVNIGGELSAAALTRGLGTKVRRTNICKIGFHVQDIAVLLITAALYILWILGMIGGII